MQFFGNAFRHQGVFLLWHLLVFSFLISRAPNEAYAKWSHFPLLARISLIALLISSFFFGTSVDGRAVGVLGEPNSLGAYAAFVWPLTGSLWFAPLAFAVILLSGSRAAFIAFCIQCAFILFTKKLHITTKLSTAFCLLLIALSLILPFLDQEADYQNRALIWQTVLSAGFAHPFIGWGFGNVEVALKETANTLANNLRFEYVDSAHNIVLDWFVQGGFVALTLITALISLSIYKMTNDKFLMSNQTSMSNNQKSKGFTVLGHWNLFRHLSLGIRHFPRSVFLISFFGLLTCLLFNPMSTAILVPFWWLMGMANKTESE